MVNLFPRPRYVPDRQFVQHSELPAPLGYTEHKVQHVVCIIFSFLRILSDSWVSFQTLCDIIWELREYCILSCIHTTIQIV